MLKDIDFYHLLEIYLTNMENNYWILLERREQMPPKKKIHEAAEATDEFSGNKFADAVAKLYDNKFVKTSPIIDENSRNVEEIIIPPENRVEILYEL